MNKKGWIRIVESFMAILLIVGVLFAIINTQNIDSGEASEKIYKSQIAILRNIESNDELRQDILEVNPNELPIIWEGFDSKGLGDVKKMIIEKTPSYLECVAQVCNITKACNLETDYYDKENIYAQSVGITATNQIYEPKQIKLFCWLR